MKKIAIMTLAAAFLLSGCNYLDIVPDERPLPENTYQNPNAARNYLYSCYSQMYNPRIPDAVDKYSGAEIINIDEKNAWATFPRGYYSPSSPGLVSDYYAKIWKGLHQCYLFLSVVDKTPNIEAIDLQYYKAEATLLIAYYHWLSFRAFGPSVIMRGLLEPLTPIEEMPERSSVDEVVKFIDEKITEAEMIGLAERHDGDEYGRFTKYVAKALRAKLYLYAASPLFNGNSDFYADFVSPLDSRPLISQTVDINKWKKAEEVTRAAIQDLENAQYRLYNATDAGVTPTAEKPGLKNIAQRTVRYTFMDNKGGTNPEVIMVDTRKEGTYEIQNQSTPRQRAANGYKNSFNNIAPSLQIVEMFYTKNGLPIDEDTEFDYSGRYNVVEMPVDYDGNGYSTKSNGKTLKLHLNREPRFFAWIAFHNGNYEIAKYNGTATASGTNHDKKAIVVKFRKNDPNGWEEGQTSNYSGTGYLNKKFVHPAFQAGPVHYPYPVIRMAEIYLNLAEILIEQDVLEGGTSRLAEAKSLIDMIRERAGILKIDEAWKKAKNPGKANTAEGMREIVRRERQIEFYLENQRFWDLRRWKQAESLGEKVWGMNVKGETDGSFFVPTELSNIRTFKQALYLMPIPMNETNKVPHIVQNPGY